MTTRATSPIPPSPARSTDWTAVLSPLLTFLAVMGGLQLQVAPITSRLDRIDTRLEKIENVGYRTDSLEKAIEEFRRRGYQP